MTEKYRPALPISVALIAKNEERRIHALHKTLRAILTHPDDEVILVDTGSTDRTLKFAKNCGWKVFAHPELTCAELAEKGKQWLPELFAQWSASHHYTGGILRSFAEARNISFSHAKNEHVMWLDLDDTILTPERLRPAIDRVFGEHRHGALLLPYHYAHDEDDGQCTTVLSRERVVTKSDFHWVGRCHELLLPVEGSGELLAARLPEEPLAIKHEAPRQHQFSDLRNYIIQRDELEKTADKPDPRVVLYYAHSCRGLGELREALRRYRWFIDHSGSAEDVFFACFSICWILRGQGYYWSAMDAMHEAQRVYPHDPRIHYELAHLWGSLQHWQNCLSEIRLGDALPPRETTHALDPVTLSFQPAALGAFAARELGLTDLAMQFAERALQSRPGLKAAQENFEDFQKWASAEEYSRMLATVLSAAPDKVEASKHLVFSPHLKPKGFGAPELFVPGGGERPTVAIWCGTSIEPWGPDPAITAIGASEKMVVELAKRLAKRFDVTVYCTLNCDEGTYDGVTYRWTASYNPNLYRDNLIIWRAPAVLDRANMRAGRIFVWMHDVGHNSYWTPTILARVDKVLFLSEFQRSLHSAVPDSKVYITRNGIDLARHIYDGRPKQKKIVFCSSPDRGLQTAVRLFKESGLAKQGYELHVFYGFGKTWRVLANERGFGFVPDKGHECNLLAYEEECKLLLANTPGVVNRGRVTWLQIADELKDAAIWFYPTQFDEISCVAAMEAMAAGCQIVATEHAALAETLSGYPGWINLNDHLHTLWAGVLAGSGGASEGVAKRWAEHARKFDLDVLAEKWAKELFSEDRNPIEG